MLKQSELNPDEQAQVFARADALFREESEQAQNARSAAQAAEELGVPQEYLDRAAAQFHAEKAEKVRAQNSRKRVMMAVGLAAIPATLAIYLSMSLMQKPTQIPAGAMAPPSVSLLLTDPTTTALRNMSSESKNSDGYYRLKVNEFFQNGNEFQANLGFPTNGSLAGYRQVSFTAKGDGISNVRVDLREGQTRWNSPEISLSPQGQRVTLNFNDLNRQFQQRGQWKSERGDGPGNARSIVFKFGQGINPPNAHGTVEISDVRFE